MSDAGGPDAGGPHAGGPQLGDADAFGLYVHVPFCARRCTYCDFDFVVGRRPRLQPYLDGIRREVDGRADLRRRTPQTLYFGGGTPSAIGADGLRALVAALDPVVHRDRLVEFTVELNPEHVDAPLVESLVALGVTRVSLGVQSFEVAALRQLGRAHTPGQAVDAHARCVDAGLCTSVDLIVGWPGQGTDALDRDLDRTLALGAGHVSVYALTIESTSSWPKLVRRKLRVLPQEDAQGEHLERVHAVLGGAGYEHYEVASYARPGRRAMHNTLYWTWCDYVGLGPSAASARYDEDGAVTRRSNPRGLDAWHAAVDPEIERLDGRRAAAEGLWLGLRTFDGVCVERFLRRFPAVDAAWLEGRVGSRVRRGDLVWEGGWLRLAPGRWLVLDGIVADLLDDADAPGAC